MYDSKRRGRNGWQAFTPELAAQQQERLQIETQLRRALDNDEFHLVYQPQVDLRTARIVAAEALMRWHNPQLGELRPDRFIDHAETTGDIVAHRRLGDARGLPADAALARAGHAAPARGGQRVLSPVPRRGLPRACAPRSTNSACPAVRWSWN